MPFTADQMLLLVADVETYPLFLPLCESLVVHERQQVDDGEDLVATMGIGYKSIREQFTTRVAIRPTDRIIRVSNVDGPFRRLENVWRFSPAGERACDVCFDITYEFRSPLLAVILGAVFETAVRRFASAFEERAHIVYGSSGYGRRRDA